MNYFRRLPILSKVVLADTGPLIAFARLDELALLAKIFERVYVTREVLAECMAGKKADEVTLIELAVARWFELVQAPPYFDLTKEMDAGEASAIAAAVERHCGVLLDDKAGRRVAHSLGLPVIGTVGALILCKRKNLIPLIKPRLDALVASGYYLGPEVIASALSACGEQY